MKFNRFIFFLFITGNLFSDEIYLLDGTKINNIEYIGVESGYIFYKYNFHDKGVISEVKCSKVDKIIGKQSSIEFNCETNSVTGYKDRHKEQKEKNNPPKSFNDIYKEITSGKRHFGVEWNLLWGWGDSDLSIAEYENFSTNGSSNEIGTNYGYNTDFSIQMTIFHKFLLRYSYIKLIEDISGRVGIDKSYYDAYYYYYDVCRYSSDYDYESSHRRKKSHIFSLGYPIKYFEYNYDSGSYYKKNNTIRFPIIIFAGIAFNNSEVMDLYWEFNYDECDYESPSYWSIENRTSEFRETKLSFGISIPYYIQTTIMYTGWDWRLMFGMGI